MNIWHNIDILIHTQFYFYFEKFAKSCIKMLFEMTNYVNPLVHNFLFPPIFDE